MSFDLARFFVFYNFFINAQNEHPETNIEILWDFFQFAKALCKGLQQNHYKHRHQSATSAYTAFYNAFHKTVAYLTQRFDISINNSAMFDLYNSIIEKYREIIISSGISKKDYPDSYLDALYKYGLYLYNSGRIKDAEPIDLEYKTLTEEKYKTKEHPTLKDAFSVAQSYNAYGVDLSAIQRYAEANDYGMESIKCSIDALSDSDSEYYLKEARTRLVELFNLLDNATPMDSKPILTEIKKTIKKIDINSDTYQLIHQLLITRGNLPWYWMQMGPYSLVKCNKSIQYGDHTYILRKIFFGPSNPLTLRSKRNTASYRLKCSEFALDEKIAMSLNQLEERLTQGIQIMEDTLKEYYNKSSFNQSAYDYILQSESTIFKKIL